MLATISADREPSEYSGVSSRPERGAQPALQPHQAALRQQQAAVSRSVAAVLARCGAGGCTCGGRCQDEEILERGQHQLRRAVAERTSARGVLQRTPARKVSCAPGPLTLATGQAIADPVAVITAAEDRANEVMDAAIGELDFAIQQIAGGAGIGWPTVSDTLGRGLRVMGLDPDDPRVWSGRGIGTARLLLRRLRLIRSTIGAGSFFFTCIGPANGRIGACEGPICGADGRGAEAASCGGSFRTNFCIPFWESDADDQAATIVHESSHNFADFILDSGREGNAECYARFVGIVGDAGDDFGSAALCADPP